jgi:hypothetical protein
MSLLLLLGRVQIGLSQSRLKEPGIKFLKKHPDVALRATVDLSLRTGEEFYNVQDHEGHKDLQQALSHWYLVTQKIRQFVQENSSSTD